LKTYKLYIGGKFPRTESGRYDVIRDKKNKPLANICRASKKDFRDAVVAARAAQGGWAKRSAYNRAQILYRIAEMLEGRSSQFIEELAALGATPAAAKREVEATVDRFVYYAGWCDKYSQVFSSVNPVASSHFNFSLPEPTGLVAIVAPDATPLLALSTLVAATIAGGNSVIVLASETNPLPSITFSEVLATSDLPGGIVNVLTGQRAELVEHFASHMDVNAVVYAATDREPLKKLQALAANNVKRVIVPKIADYFGDKAESPYLILDTQEVKTTWHPVGT
jgi:acyl-CoA reductase-like NAD-dependent aldehyde dehydrogenase